LPASTTESHKYEETEPNKYGKRFLEVGIAAEYVGTDPMHFEDFKPYVLTAQLAPYLPPPFQGSGLVPTIVLFKWEALWLWAIIRWNVPR
jgi:hypothetical protein